MTNRLQPTAIDGAGVSALVFCLPMLEAADAGGVDGAAILNGFELSPFDLHDPVSRLPPEVVAGFSEKVGAQLSIPAFHLHLAETAPPGSFDLPEMILRTATNVRAQLEEAATWSRLFFDGPLKLNAHADQAELELRCSDPSTANATVVESVLARLLIVIRETTGLHVRPRAVCLQANAPPHAERLRQLFDAPLRFGQRTNELLFDLSVLDQPTRTNDPRLHRTLRRVAADVCDRLPVLEQFSQRVRQMIRQTLPEHDPSIHRIAAKLCMSSRTLQRKLSEENSTYQRVLDRLRLELSIEYLAMSRMPIAEAATLLGFADLTSFHRAFKRWTGTPPAEFRKQLRGSRASADRSA